MTTYSSRKTEDFWLDFFWQGCRDDRADRLELLQVLSRVRLTRQPGWSYWHVRRGEYRLSGDSCFACKRREPRLHTHHLIQVQHGGSNSSRNLVLLCTRCHAHVHPWLAVELVCHGWYRVGQLAEAALMKLGFVARDTTVES